MIIANPIYDTYFKRLMENERTVKFFIGTLLDCEVLQVDLRPQELTYVDADNTTRIYRVDFAAVVRYDQDSTKKERTQKVLIEVQKAHDHTDLMRFRSYLGEHYSREDVGHTTPLPITTIYILGTNLPEIQSPCFKVGREYVDLFTHQPIAERSKFMERLTHDSYVVQVERLPEHHGTNKLYELLSIFEQRQFMDEYKLEKSYTYNPVHEEVVEMCRTLCSVASDPEARKQAMGELLYERQRRSDYSEVSEKLEEAKVEIAEAKAEIADAKVEIADAKAAIEEKDKALKAALAELQALKKQQNN
jgi:hypothetical protein